MDNFIFYSPTKVLFGKGVDEHTGETIREMGFSKILFHYSGGSIKKSGLYDRIKKSLEASDVEFLELDGVEPNPKLSLVREGIELCRKNKIQMILAVGGGSVIDSSKAIGLGVFYDGDIWDVYKSGCEVKKSLPVGSVLTISAAGSELSNSSVITNGDIPLKRGFNSDITRPIFAIMNPELTFSVSKRQTACGITDILMHTLERYFSGSPNTPLTDNIAEGLMKAVIRAGKTVMQNPDDYNARAELMWASSLSHNHLTGLGRLGDWASHQISHEISGMFDNVAHGEGLSVIFPAWCKYVYRDNPKRFRLYGENVWGIKSDSKTDEQVALEAIAATENFFKSLDMPTRLSEIGISAEHIDPMTVMAFSNKSSVGTFKKLVGADVIEIFKLAL